MAREMVPQSDCGRRPRSAPVPALVVRSGAPVLPVVAAWAPLLVSSPMRPHIAALSLALVVALAAPAGPAAAGAPAPARTASAAKPKAAAAAHLALPFIQDDYPRALAEARARKVPLFIEAWAPW
jgi:hypothetical protein